MSRIRPIPFIASLACVAACSSGAVPGDFISLNAGGLMSSSLEISIDLTTGVAKKAVSPRGTVAPGEVPHFVETERTLTNSELQKLNDLIRASVSAGLETKSCADQDRAANLAGKRIMRAPPLADSITFMRLQIDGQQVGMPANECRSSAFSAVWKAAYDAVGP